MAALADAVEVAVAVVAAIAAAAVAGVLADSIVSRGLPRGGVTTAGIALAVGLGGGGSSSSSSSSSYRATTENGKWGEGEGGGGRGGGWGREREGEGRERSGRNFSRDRNVARDRRREEGVSRYSSARKDTARGDSRDRYGWRDRNRDRPRGHDRSRSVGKDSHRWGRSRSRDRRRSGRSRERSSTASGGGRPPRPQAPPAMKDHRSRSAARDSAGSDEEGVAKSAKSSDAKATPGKKRSRPTKESTVGSTPTLPPPAPRGQSPGAEATPEALLTMPKGRRSVGLVKKGRGRGSQELAGLSAASSRDPVHVRRPPRVAAVVAADKIKITRGHDVAGSVAELSEEEATPEDVVLSTPKPIGPPEWVTARKTVAEMMALDKAGTFKNPPVASVGRGTEYKFYLLVVSTPCWLDQIQKQVGQIKVACRWVDVVGVQSSRERFRGDQRIVFLC